MGNLFHFLSIMHTWQTPQLLGQLNRMYFGFFPHSPLNAQDLQCTFLSSQADGKKVKQYTCKYIA